MDLVARSERVDGERLHANRRRAARIITPMATTGSTKRSTRRTKASRTARAAAPALAPIEAPRVDVVDAARGFAVAMMIAYHFCFDLTWFRWTDWAMLADARWIAWRSAIVASFLFVAGLSLALRDEREGRGGTTGRGRWLDRAFVRRWLQIALAAALVTAGSAALFPQTFIYFGVLHFVAVAIVLCRRAPRLRGWAVVVGVAVIAIGLGWSDAAFNPRVVDWIGFATEKPLTEDYVPIFPWLGVVLIGCGVGAWWARTGFRLPAAAQATWDALPRALRGACSRRWGAGASRSICCINR